MWREGNWDGITKEFPNFNIATTGQVDDQRIPASYVRGVIPDEYPMSPVPD